MSTWMQYKIRARWFQGNLPLIILKLLRESPLGEWEILDSLYHSLRLAPNEREFERLIKSFVRLGYLQVVFWRKEPRLRINKAGLKLLSELEREQYAILRELNPGSSQSRKNFS